MLIVVVHLWHKLATALPGQVCIVAMQTQLLLID